MGRRQAAADDGVDLCAKLALDFLQASLCQQPWDGLGGEQLSIMVEQ